MRKPSEAFQPPRVGGGAKGIRTPDLYNANVARYHLLPTGAKIPEIVAN